MPIGAFLEALASKRLTPSGGSTAAVGGAMGAACCEMVCVHTDGVSVPESSGADASTPTDSPAPGDLSEAAAELAACRERLLELADEDVAAVGAFDSALEGDEAARADAEARLLAVPIRTAEACLVVLECAEVVLAAGNPRALADGVTGVLLADGALEAAVYTARTNLGASESPAAATERRLSALETDAAAARRRALAAADRASERDG